MERKYNKQPKLHIKKGDKVCVIAGNEKGREGVITKVLIEKQRAIVEGLNKVTKHIKPNAQNNQGGIEEIEASIHISNLMVIDPATGQPRRTGKKRNAQGKLERYFKQHTSVKK